MTCKIQSQSLEDTEALAQKIASELKAPRVINLCGDLGSGKTTLTKGIAKGLGCSDDVSSPSFTIMRKYSCNNNVQLHHYDFYRLSDAGIQAMELEESFNDEKAITIIEWAEAANISVPGGSIEITITTIDENSREFSIEGLDVE